MSMSYQERASELESWLATESESMVGVGNGATGFIILKIAGTQSYPKSQNCQGCRHVR